MWVYSTFEAQQYDTIGFSRKILETRNFFLIFCLSRNVGPKPTDQSCSNSISGSPCKYFLSPFFFLSFLFFFFDLLSKWRVVHIRKKLKMFVFRKNSSTIFIKFCEFLVHSNLNNMTLSAIHVKSFKLKKNHFLIFYPSPSLATKPTDWSYSNSILRVTLQIYPARFFLFRPTIKIKGSLLKKQANELSDKNGILQTCSILLLFLCY